MLNWRAVTSISELKLFQIAFRALPDDEKDAICAEMIIHVQEYQDSVTVNGEIQTNLKLARDSRAGPVVREVRRRRPRSR